MIDYHLVVGNVRVVMLALCGILSSLLIGCGPPSQGLGERTINSAEHEKREAVKRLLREFQRETLSPERADVIRAGIVASGWPAIEVLNANLENRSTAYGVIRSLGNVPPGEDLDGSIMRIGEICEILLHKIVVPADHVESKTTPRVSDWDVWIKAHRGMTIEEIHRQWNKELDRDK